MLFEVSSKVKGTLLLKTANNKILRAGSKVFIEDSQVSNNDVKRAVNNKQLIPIGKIKIKKKKEVENVVPSSKVRIINNTKKFLVLDNISIGPEKIKTIDKDIFDSSKKIKAALKSGYISVTDGLPVASPPVEEKQEEQEEEISPDLKKEMEEKKKDIKDGTVAKTWSPKEKKLEKAIKPPVTIRAEMIDIDEEEPVKVVKKRGRPKKNNSSETKKKETSPKKTKVKGIEPVGEVRKKASPDEVAIEMDSRGNPVEKPSETLKHLIEEIDPGENIDLIDE